MYKPYHKVRSSCTISNDSHNNAKDARLNIWALVSNLFRWLSYLIALPDFYFHLSSWHIAYIAIRVEWGIVCVASPIVSFSNRRTGLERQRVSHFDTVCGDSQLNAVQHHVRHWKRGKLQEIHFPAVEQLFSQRENVFWNKILKQIWRRIALCQSNYEN